MRSGGGEMQIFKQEWMREWIERKKGHSKWAIYLSVELVFSSSFLFSYFLILSFLHSLSPSLSPIIVKWLPGSHASSSYLDLRTQKEKTDRRALDLTKEQGMNKWMNQRKTARTYNSPETGALPLVFFFYNPLIHSFFIQVRNCSRAAPTAISPFSLPYLHLLALSFLSLSLPFTPLSILTLWISSLCVGSMIEL